MKTAEEAYIEYHDNPSNQLPWLHKDTFMAGYLIAIRHAAEICGKQKDGCPVEDYDDGYNSGIDCCKRVITATCDKLEALNKSRLP